MRHKPYLSDMLIFARWMLSTHGQLTQQGQARQKQEMLMMDASRTASRKSPPLVVACGEPDLQTRP